MDLHATAVWQGTLKEGKGTLSLQSGAAKDIPYGFAKRFGDEKGANPEELVGAAHASCFAMTMSANLGEQGKDAVIDATSTVSLDMSSGTPTVTKARARRSG